MARKWIQGAVKHEGALTRKAKAAGESVAEYARAHADEGGRTGRQARLAITLRKMAKKR